MKITMETNSAHTNQNFSKEIRGNNYLQEGSKKTVLHSFGEQLNDPLIYILFAAALISMLLGEYSDMLIIVSIIFVNTIIGMIQEGKAQKSLEALKQLTSPHAILVRGAIQEEILAKDLIPGDLVYLDAGRQVPADLKIIQATDLKIEESTLTGESLPVTKDTKNNSIAYMSTNVTYGKGLGEVIAIGMDTQIGTIASLINEAPRELTPLQKRLSDLGKLLSILSILLCILLFLIAIFQKREIMEMLITAISLAVAAVPEGLPAIVTMVLAFSVSRMVRINTIVKRLPSVETLGSVSVICSDKTGTLTQNKMTVTTCYIDGKIIPIAELSEKENSDFLQAICLCNDATIDGANRIGDPTELALLDLAYSKQLSIKDLSNQMKRIDEIPFDSTRKMMTTLHKTALRKISYTKGSLEEVLACCTRIMEYGTITTLTKHHKREIQKAISSMTNKALRVLAVAMNTNIHTPCESNLIFLGLVGMIDPIRPEAYAAVKACEDAHVRTVMITGDRMDTALAIGKDLGIAESLSDCMSGEELDTLSKIELKKLLPYKSIFAHVSPAHKVSIVSALKESGAIVAMTGDGVNDAPSLKTADVGIAMGITGTDVAKNAADLILTDDNFATIAKAIEEGRNIYENIKKTILFLLSSNFGEIMIMLTAILMGLSSPLKSAHILWINLITDSLPALALGIDETRNQNHMKRPPRRKKESFFHGGGLSCTFFYGFLIALITLTAYLKLPIQLLLQEQLPLTLSSISQLLLHEDLLIKSQTYAFTVLGMSQLFHAIGMRDVEQSIFKMNHLQNKLMIAALIIGIGLQFMVTEIPYFITAFGTSRLTSIEWLQLIVLSAMPLIAHELLLFPTYFKKTSSF